jgi:hypothetical protein
MVGEQAMIYAPWIVWDDAMFSCERGGLLDECTLEAMVEERRGLRDGRLWWQQRET